MRNCTQCDGSGWLITARGANPCECAIERKIQSRLPSHYVRARLSDFPEDIVRLVANSLAEPLIGLLITGSTGRGKTHLASAICRDQIEHRRDTVFMTWERFFAALRESYRAGTSEQGVIGPLEHAPFLAMDDLGAGSVSDHERRSTLALLDRRNSANLRTIVTTNWSLQKIGDCMDDRIASRLARFRNIELVGTDRRLGPVV